MKHLPDSRHEPLQMIFNYNDIFFSFFDDDAHGCTHRSHDYALNHVYSGEMILDNGRQQLRIAKGQSVFIPRDHHITLYKRPCDGERYCGLYMRFTRPFLREAYARMRRQEGAAPAGTDPRQTQQTQLPEAVLLPKSPELESLFASMVPYFDPEVKPAEAFMQLKLQEGLLALLHIDPRFERMLFDFNEPWKIDILEFLEQNYMYEFSLGELAHYTGRSLATFKRDFRKISDLPPEKWLIRRRLEAAYARLSDGGAKVVDVYAEVGFKNPSHFSTAFKRQFGISPTAVSSLARKQETPNGMSR